MCKKIPAKRGVQPTFAISLTAFWMATLTLCPILAGQEVNVSVQPDDTHDVKLQIDYDGAVLIYSQGEEEGQQKETRLPLEVRARLAFEQQSAISDQQAIRHYQKAAAKITINEKSHTNALEQTNRTIHAYLAANRSQTKPVLLASEFDILQQSEQELINTPFDLLTLPGFFSKQETKINEPWSPNDQDVINVLAINRIYDNEVKLTVKTHNDRESKIYITGSATGEVDGEDVSVDLRGVALIDNQKHFVKSLRVNINESRNAGQIAPGFNGLVKLDLKVTPKKTAENIPPAVITRAREFRSQKLAWKPKNSFEIYFDPRWRLITNEDQAAVMRLLDDGDLLAQCNIVQLPNLAADSVLELKEFRDEVGKIIDGSPAKVISSDKRITSRDLYVLQVEVLGEEDGVEIRWIYNHVAHKDGRRLTFVFTVEDEVYDYFANFSHSLIDSVIFKNVEKRESTASKSETQKKR